MSDLAARLAAGFRDARSRLDEQEKVALAATEGPWVWEGDYPYGHCPHTTEWTDHGPDLVGQTSERPDVISALGYDSTSLSIKDSDAEHIAANDPTHVLAGVSVSRRQLDALEQIAELHRDDGGYCDHGDWPCPTFYLVAAGLGIEL
jgi:hypothetical protein